MKNLTFKKLQILSLLSLGFLIQTVQLKNNVCVNSKYRKIPYTTKFIHTYVSEILNVSSAYRCLKLCRDRGTCKSVGIKTNSKSCYLYDDRVYAGLSGTTSSDITYYWLLEPECPVHLGYSEDPTSKLCTKYNSTEVTWSEAQNQCENEGGLLFMVDNQDSQNVMTTYLKSGVLVTDRYIFIGATDINEEGVWEWFNGVPVDLAAFIEGDPNNHEGNEHCLMYVAGQYPSFVDHDCNRAFGFFCQIQTTQTYLP